MARSNHVLIGKVVRNAAIVCAVIVSLVMLTNRAFDPTLHLKPMNTSPKSNSELKILVGITVGEKCRQRVDQMVARWGTTRFKYELFHYDKSDWSSLEHAHTKNPAINHHYDKGLKMAHYKKHVTPDKVDGYDYFFLVDCDAGLDNFDVETFLTILEEHQPPLAQPSVDHGSLFDRSSDHRTCRTFPGSHSGRWTSTVEVGPLVSFTAEAWQCVYDLVQGDLGSGWGLDYYWCVYARDVCGLGYPAGKMARTEDERRGGHWGFTCAVIDAVHIAHLDERTATGLFGNDYQPRNDVYEFARRFPQLERTRNADGLCACDDRDYIITPIRVTLLQVSVFACMFADVQKSVDQIIFKLVYPSLESDHDAYILVSCS
eukprot:TRINITY_DN7247_c0_g5_i1.p1 TRINITY_DN7247_c0_g5~~TRINITY_DN7247_c0_g5_i1.p1  ORF type:complete len:373 (+),score=27.62 TRINITY_DN7247_c0_g5_i1:88-1206(+)